MQVQQVELVATDRLRGNPHNPKKPLGLKARKGLRASLERYGFAGIFVVAQNDDGTCEILDGNTRLEELQRAGVERVPCVVYRGMPDDERRAFTLAHDRHRKQFDEEAVREQLAGLAGREGADTQALAKLAGKPVDKLLREASVRQAAAEGQLKPAAAEAVFPLFGPPEDIVAVREAMKAIRERLPLLTKASRLLGEAVAALDDARLLPLILSAHARFKAAAEAGEGGQ
jgi:ParB-like chromosome segregation protein Spo0J